jgi:hypothetical protein
LKVTKGKILARLLASSSVLGLPACEAIPSCAPPVNGTVVQAGLRQHADARLLIEGRTLFSIVASNVTPRPMPENAVVFKSIICSRPCPGARI